MKKILAVCFLTYLISPEYSLAQTQVAKGFEIQEIIKIAEMYKNVTNLSFNLDYKYADSAHADSVLENVTGFSKISDGRYYTFLDSAEYIQGYQYNLAVFYRDSAIVVNNRQEYADLMKLPVLDSLFSNEYVDSMKIYQTDDVPTNTLYLYFPSNSPYGNYVLVYDRNNYQIQHIQFYIRNVPTDDGVTSGTALMRLDMSGYSTSAVSQDLFWEDKFVYKQSGQLYLKPTYSSFQLMDNTTSQNQ